MSKKQKMTREAARRIQRNADRTGRNEGFKRRAMKSAYRNEPNQGSDSESGSGNEGSN